MRTEPPTTTQVCEAHKRHAPDPLYCELHHVVPQSWQQLFKPETPTHPGRGTEGRILWDARTVALCRTGHGNTHVWIVRFMQMVEYLYPDVKPPSVGLTVQQARARARQEHKGETQNLAEIDFAKEALSRFTEAGGDLHVLIAHNEYGAI